MSWEGRTEATGCSLSLAQCIMCAKRVLEQDVDHEFGQLDESQSSQGGGTVLSASEEDN